MGAGVSTGAAADGLAAHQPDPEGHLSLKPYWYASSCLWKSWFKFSYDCGTRVLTRPQGGERVLKCLRSRDDSLWARKRLLFEHTAYNLMEWNLMVVQFACGCTHIDSGMCRCFLEKLVAFWPTRKNSRISSNLKEVSYEFVLIGNVSLYDSMMILTWHWSMFYSFFSSLVFDSVLGHQTFSTRFHPSLFGDCDHFSYQRIMHHAHRIIPCMIHSMDTYFDKNNIKPSKHHFLALWLLWSRTSNILATMPLWT